MRINKKLLNIILTLFISTTCYFSVGAMQKKDNFSPNENLFSPSKLEKNELESYLIFIKNNTDLDVNGPTAQIFNKAFKNQLVKTFRNNYNIDIKNYVDENEIPLIKKENLKDKFKMNLDIKKNNKNIKITREKFQKFINNLNKNKQRLKKIADETKKDLNKNFEKYRKEIRKDLETMNNFYKKRENIFNSAVSNKKKEFLSDFKKFANLAANSYEIYNKDKIKDKRQLHKNAEELKKEAKNLNLKGKLFEMYKNKILDQKPKQVENFVKNFKLSLSKVKKSDVLDCCNVMAEKNLKFIKY